MSEANAVHKLVKENLSAAVIIFLHERHEAQI